MSVIGVLSALGAGAAASSAIGALTKVKQNNIGNTNASQALSHAEMREDTAIQRRVADLKAAGLNPILAAQSGMGAGANSSASSNQVSSTAANTNAFSNLVSSAITLLGVAKMFTGK